VVPQGLIRRFFNDGHVSSNLIEELAFYVLMSGNEFGKKQLLGLNLPEPLKNAVMSKLET
jgi:hypothetical protein